MSAERSKLKHGSSSARQLNIEPMSNIIQPISYVQLSGELAGNELGGRLACTLVPSAASNQKADDAISREKLLDHAAV